MDLQFKTNIHTRLQNIEHWFSNHEYLWPVNPNGDHYIFFKRGGLRGIGYKIDLDRQNNLIRVGLHSEFEDVTIAQQFFDEFHARDGYEAMAYDNHEFRIFFSRNIERGIDNQFVYNAEIENWCLNSCRHILLDTGQRFIEMVEYV